MLISQLLFSAICSRKMGKQYPFVVGREYRGPFPQTVAIVSPVFNVLGILNSEIVNSTGKCLSIKQEKLN